eukprot:159841-Chlamydomonas_euryale.AAC.1
MASCCAAVEKARTPPVSPSSPPPHTKRQVSCVADACVAGVGVEHEDTLHLVVRPADVPAAPPPPTG